jgi:hypothetical protein
MRHSNEPLLTVRSKTETVLMMSAAPLNFELEAVTVDVVVVMAVVVVVFEIAVHFE